MRNASPHYFTRHYFTRHYFTRGCLLLLATLIGLADPARVMAGPEVSAQISAKNATRQGPPIEIVTSPAGHTAWLVRDTSLPMVTLKVAWRGGSASDPEGQSGLGALLGDMLTRGAGARAEQNFQQALAQQAVRMSFEIGRDELTGSLQCLSAHLDACFDLFTDAVSRPRFDADAVTRSRQRLLTRMRSNEQRPAYLARANLLRTSFAGHPYARAVEGTPDDVNNLTPDDLRTHWRRHIAQDNVLISAVGNISADALGKKLDAFLRDLPKRAQLAAIPTAQPVRGPASHHISRAGPQTSIAFGAQGVVYDDPMFFAAYVMNYILGGGGFASILTEEVREKRGLAYSVYSYLAPYKYGALWMGGLATKNESAMEAMDVVRDALRSMARDGVSDARLKAAKTYLIGAYALRFDSGVKIADQLLGIQINGWPVDYFETRNQHIRNVSKADIAAAATRLMQPDGLIISTVGGQSVTMTAPAKRK